MGRAKLSVENIRRHTYVCEDHFDEGVVLDYRLVRYHKSAENWSFLKFIHTNMLIQEPLKLCAFIYSWTFFSNVRLLETVGYSGH